MKINIENKLLSIDNYIQIIEVNNDLIVLEKVRVYGYNLKIIKLDPYQVVMQGNFSKIEFGEGNNV
ncbi:MAG: YabP/YqfC family sporulation protein [Anaeroplasma sp.]